MSFLRATSTEAEGFGSIYIGSGIAEYGTKALDPRVRIGADFVIVRNDAAALQIWGPSLQPPVARCAQAEYLDHLVVIAKRIGSIHSSIYPYSVAKLGYLIVATRLA